MTRLFLVRHGETDYNLGKRYCGFSNPSLNDRGMRQSEKLATGLKEARIDKVYSSDLKRAYQTAEIVFKNNSIEKLTDFREMNFGIFEGLKYEEIAEIYPKLYRKWIDEPMTLKIPSGECLRDLCKRVKKGLSFILSKHKDRSIALVSHGGPIRILLCEALRLDLKTFWKIEQEPGALNIIDYPKDSQPVIVKINDIAHLSNEESAS